MNAVEQGTASRRSIESEFAPADLDSGVYELSDHAVLLLCRPGHDLWTVAEALQDEGFSLVPVADPARVDALGFLPRYGVIEGSMPGALEFLRRVSQPALAMHTVGVLTPGEREGALLAAGASMVLQRPLAVADVLLCLKRLRAQHDLASSSRDLFAEERISISTPVLEGVLATIGHEIRNPLAAALANVECLRDHAGLSPLSAEERRATIDDMVLSLRRIQHVVTAVSGLVKGAAPELEKVEFWKIASRVVATFRKQGVSVEIAGEERVRGWASPSLLEQVVVNLVQNAIDATSEVRAPEILVRVYEVSGEARISVRDNGPGVPPSLRERIFEPFFTTKGERGTGLGLVLVRHAVARMGGTLSLGNAERGAVFRVRLRSA